MADVLPGTAVGLQGQYIRPRTPAQVEGGFSGLHREEIELSQLLQKVFGGAKYKSDIGQSPFNASKALCDGMDNLHNPHTKH